ncbi:MAG TPA: molybdopterin-dependent oxidoreductase [Candidatus Polarisedimenticolia bacterium]|nr:molybdopterin-dependent oxidoreductase [Candidatus Polarisedimenticolia bacterium]
MSAVTLSRRRFLGAAGLVVAGSATAGCDRVRRFLQYSPSRAPSALVAGRANPADLFSICDNCVNKCGLRARVVDGRVVKLDPNPYFPKSRAMLCAKGNAGIKVVHDPDRLKHPLIRVGERGSGQWRKASWDEALDLVATRLKEVREAHGPQGVLFSSSEGFQERFFKTFAQAFGSPNVCRHPSLCLASSNLGFFITYGTVPEFDIENCRYIIMSGANRLESFITPDSIDLMSVLRTKKARLVYLDPRFTVTASKADEWLPIRPGTDLAFYLALINVLIVEGLYDRPFVESYTHGFEDLASHVRPFTPEWAAGETDIPADRIRSIAREFAYYAPRAVIYRGRRSSWYTNDTEMRQAMAIANALVGNWDRPGGVVPKESITLGGVELPEPPYPEASRCDGIEEAHPLSRSDDGAYLDLRDHVLADDPYPLRAWLIYKQNPMHALPDRRRTEAMFRKMDLVVVIDIMPTDSAWLADVILPESTYLERTDPVESFNTPYPFVAWRRQVVPPQFNTRTCLQIMQGLAGRLDLKQFFDYDIDRFIAAQLGPLGLHPEDFNATGMWTDQRTRPFGSTLTPEFRFRTPSGKIELASERLRRRGLDPLPRYVAPSRPADGRFRLIPGKQAWFTHAALQNNEWLHEICPENRLWINREEAERRRIAGGDWVVVRSSIGSVRIRAHVTDRIRPDCVHIPHGFGHRSPALRQVAGRGASDQDLIEPHEDRLSGNAALHETFVTVEKA